MLTIQVSKTVGKCLTNGETKMLSNAAPSKTLHAISMTKIVTANNSFKCHRDFTLPITFSDYWHCSKQFRSHSIWRRPKQRTTKRNLEFISAGVNAYALGCTDEGLRKELMNMRDSVIKIEGLQTYGGNTSLKNTIYFKEVHECILWLSIIFITILCTPQPTVVRWSSTPPVSTKTMLQWKGFCALIANAYYIKGMAWLPVKTLQLEQMAVMGRAEEPYVVASRMRLVFSTLEVVSPQWPRV